MTSFHASQMRRCLLAAAVAQALIAVPAFAQGAPAGQNASVSQTAPDNQAAPGQSNVDKEQSKKPVTLQTVVVTAQRRTQNLQEVPISVSAIDAAQLSARGITSIGDLISAAPSTVVMTGTGGYTTTAQVAIRGSWQSNPAMYWDSPVGVYLNGVYISKVEGSLFELPDLERIEVLRGPQGTLYGRNTMGGAINLITRPPSGEFGGNASLGFGNYNSKVGNLALDLPAMGKLNMSLGGRVERRDGFVGPTASSPRQIRQGDLDNRDAFVALRLNATDNLTVDYRYDYNKADNTPLFSQATHSDVAQVFHIPGIIVNQERQGKAAINYDVYERSRSDLNALTVQWKLGAPGTLKFIGAHRELHWGNGLDLDGSPIAFAQTNINSRYRQTSYELQYLGSVGRWNWVGGFYYFQDKGFTYSPQHYFLGGVNFNDNYYGFGTPRSRALYGQADYKLTDKLTVTAGIRRTIESKSISRVEVLAPNIPIIPPGTQAHTGFSATTPTVSFSYQLNADHMIYARYAKGYIGGGFNGEGSSVAAVITPFRPETEQTYELGTKSELWGGRARINADVFYNRMNDLQRASFTAEGSAGNTIFNVGKAHIKGLELDAELRATENLSLHATYSYMKGKYDKFMDAGVDVANNRAMVLLPRHTASFVVDNTFLRTSHGVLRGTLDYRFSSGYYFSPYQLRLVDPTKPVAANNWIKSYGTVNGQLAFTGMAWGPRVDGEVALWVHNITNVAHVSNRIDFGPGFGNLRIGNWNAPRTFGVNFTARW